MRTGRTRGSAAAAFFDNRMSELFERFSDAMKSAIPDVATLEGFRTQVESQLGAETEVVSEEMLQQDGMDVYLRKSKFTNTGDMLIATTFATSADGTIEGFSIRPDQGGNGGGASRDAESLRDQERDREAAGGIEGDYVVD